MQVVLPVMEGGVPALLNCRRTATLFARLFEGDIRALPYLRGESCCMRPRCFRLLSFVVKSQTMAGARVPGRGLSRVAKRAIRRMEACGGCAAAVIRILTRSAARMLGAQ